MDALREANVRDERDEDFLPDSPPARKPSKKGVTSKGKRGKGTKEKVETEIKIKDERKFAKSGPDESMDASSSKAAPGGKRRRGGSISKDSQADAESLPAAKSSTTVPGAPSEEQPPASQPPPPPKKKLPTIKKNKTLASASGQASGPSTPNASSARQPPVGGEPSVSKLGLPKKPAARMEYKSFTERMGVTDLDLSKPDIYTSLFKKVS
jgi:hypothetical protein